MADGWHADRRSDGVLSRRTLLAAVPAALTLGLAACTSSPAPSSSPSRPAPSRAPSATPTPTPTPTFDRAAHSIDDPASLWVVANKRRPLQPKSYVPPDLVAVPVEHTNPPQLRRESAAAVVTMFAAAKREGGFTLYSCSAYRSYAYQVRVYGEDLAAHGRAFADSDTARPGYSEHQTGWSIDIGSSAHPNPFSAAFGATAEGRWLAANAWRFGFLLRYPQGLERVTGYIYEPWHFRYLGTPLAAELHRTGTATLEQFFGLAAAPTYG